jgi:hypothetical protein
LRKYFLLSLWTTRRCCSQDDVLGDHPPPSRFRKRGCAGHQETPPLRSCSGYSLPGLAGNAAQPTGDTRSGKNSTLKFFLSVNTPLPRETRYWPKPQLSPHPSLVDAGSRTSSSSFGKKNSRSDAREGEATCGRGSAGGGSGAGEEGRTTTTASTATPPLQRPPTAATADTRKVQGRPAATATWSSPLKRSSPSVAVFSPVSHPSFPSLHLFSLVRARVLDAHGQI